MDNILIQEILEFVEQNRRPDGRHMSLCLEGYTDDNIQYHARLCVEDGLFTKLGGPTDIYPIELTSAGHRRLRELRVKDPRNSRL